MSFPDKIDQISSFNDNTVSPEDILSSVGFVVSVGPREYDTATTDLSTVIKPIGLIQSFYMSGSKNVRTIFELGTRKKTIVASKGPKQLMLTRVMTFNKNVLASLYSYNDASDVFNYDLGAKESVKPIGLIITLLKEDRTIIGHMYFQDALIESHAENRTAGERGIMEQVSVKWANYIFIGVV